MSTPTIRPTGLERTFGQDDIIVSKTDTKGKMTYVNQVFLEVAGYTERELLDQPHNVIRHPDMPRSIFKLLWETIEDRREIFAYVVNMAKNGDHYWVLAHVTPTFDARHAIIRFHSNRRCPKPAAVRVIEPIYRQLLEEERKHSSIKEAMAASTALLQSILQATELRRVRLRTLVAVPTVQEQIRRIRQEIDANGYAEPDGRDEWSDVVSTSAVEITKGPSRRKSAVPRSLVADCERYTAWIERAADVCEVAARGNLEVRLLGCEADGVIERMARSISYLLDVTDAFVRESGAALAAAADHRYHRKIILQGLLGPFRLAAETINETTERMEEQTALLTAHEAERAALAVSVDQVATSVQDAAKSVQATAHGLKQSADSTAAQTSTVAAAAEETSTIVQTVAAATEELSVTAAEIERHMREVARIANEAVEGANKTTVTVQGLAAAQNKIGLVVKTISQVASQTNLLALNATIESARAGETGKGFAVVASEVKSLSRQTAVATESIENEIESIHTAATASASAIDEISRIIHSLDDVSKTVMISVDEQRSATREISQSIQQAAAATADVTKSIVGVNDAAHHTSTAIDDLQAAADDLSRNSDSLKRSMQQLLSKQYPGDGSAAATAAHAGRNEDAQ